MALVTVVIPAYNPGPLLRRALDSVIAQEFTNWDCVVIDDGGTEDLTWIDGHHPQVRRHRQGNSGVSSARNSALLLTDAPLLAYLDQDDEWLPTKLAEQVASLGSAAFSYTGFTWVRPDGSEQSSIATAYDYSSFIEDGHICLSSLVIRRDAVLRVGGFNPLLRVQQDYDLVLRLLAAGATCRHTERVLVKYYLHVACVSLDYVTAYRERMNVYSSHEVVARRACDRATLRALKKGRRQMRRVYGAQAFDAFRSDRTVVHILRASSWSPTYTMRALGKALQARLATAHLRVGDGGRATG